MPTVKVVLDNFASSLALSSDYSQVVIAGSHIFKIFAIGDCELTEKANLYVAKHYNSNFSSSDVVWNPIDENRLATVATNGAVVTWDLNKSTRSKLDYVFKDHERPVNKVSFHPVESHLLISGLQGGLIKLFDTRRRETVITFTSNSESIRDIQFNPHTSYYFAAGTENGNVQFWDTRKPDRTEHQFTEHSGPVFGLDWHPECRWWIATAGRDHTIKVWDLMETSNLSKSTRSVQGVWSVRRVKWRPKKKYHLASCALTMDCSINVWDIRRPYIPFSSFHEHKDVTQGIAWKGDANILLSVGKDNTLIYHSMEDATHPIENTNPAALGLNPNGLIAAARPKENNNEDYGFHMNRKSSFVNDDFGPVSSEMLAYNNIETCVVGYPSSRSIVECATKYRLSGKSLSEVCEHNAAVDRRLDRHKEAMTWQMVQLLYGGVGPNSGDGVSYKEEQKTDSNADSDQKHVRHISGETGLETPAGPGGMSAEEPDTETDDTDNHDMKLKHIASGVTVSHDYFFGDEECSVLKFDYDSVNQLDSNSHGWMLPNEAFQPRKNILCRSDSPPNDGFSSNSQQKEDLQGPEDSRLTGRVEEYVMADCLRLSEMELEPTPPMDFIPVISDVLRYYARMGDVQLAVTLVIVLGDRVKNLVDEATLEHWFLSYIEILHRLNLWNTATEVIQSAHGIPQVREMNQQETKMSFRCGACGHNLSDDDKFCRKECGTIPSLCAVCHSVVEGLFVWCQGCSHGGHLQHMFDWIKDNRSCPTGCGHHCEYD